MILLLYLKNPSATLLSRKNGPDTLDNPKNTLSIVFIGTISLVEIRSNSAAGIPVSHKDKSFKFPKVELEFECNVPSLRTVAGKTIPPQSLTSLKYPKDAQKIRISRWFSKLCPFLYLVSLWSPKKLTNFVSFSLGPGPLKYHFSPKSCSLMMCLLLQAVTL